MVTLYASGTLEMQSFGCITIRNSCPTEITEDVRVHRLTYMCSGSSGLIQKLDEWLDEDLNPVLLRQMLKNYLHWAWVTPEVRVAAKIEIHQSLGIHTTVIHIWTIHRHTQHLNLVFQIMYVYEYLFEKLYKPLFSETC